MMKRLFCLLLAVCMAVSLCACRKDSEKVAENNTPSSDGEVSAPAEIIRRMSRKRRTSSRPRRNPNRHKHLPTAWMWI